ncbi:MAG: hypothetical protein LUG91_09775 [Ruminococcus sp.]|nr:hypothetical protein [Ruminococcus sp.]
MVATKRKKMTNREKAERARKKKELQELGFMPPDKPKLNRKKYVDEARKEWNNRGSEWFIWEVYLYKAIEIMLGKTDKNFRVSPEAVGVAKSLKLAMHLKAFSDQMKAEGRKEYKAKELYDYIEDILDA